MILIREKKLEDPINKVRTMKSVSLFILEPLLQPRTNFIFLIPVSFSYF